MDVDYYLFPCNHNQYLDVPTTLESLAVPLFIQPVPITHCEATAVPISSFEVSF
jgi:hypothetical protein